MSLRIVLSYGVGMYSGIFVAQNYDIPPVDNVNNFLEHLERKVNELKPKPADLRNQEMSAVENADGFENTENQDS
ncbi:hypothetical protein WDU94_014870 [Cyamophila willieti]